MRWRKFASDDIILGISEGLIICYYRIVPERRFMRRLVAALCVALLLCIALTVAGPDLTCAIPALTFCFFVLLMQSAFVRCDRNSAVRSLCSRAVSGPRAPPRA